MELHSFIGHHAHTFTNRGRNLGAGRKPENLDETYVDMERICKTPEVKAVPNEGTWITVLLEVMRWFQLMAKCCPIQNIQQKINQY